MRADEDLALIEIILKEDSFSDAKKARESAVKIKEFVLEKIK